MSESFAPEDRVKLYKLRNAGGVESWFSEKEKQKLFSNPETVWEIVETKYEDEVEAAIGVPAAEAPASMSDAAASSKAPATSDGMPPSGEPEAAKTSKPAKAEKQAKAGR